jgi:hypothetical protein
MGASAETARDVIARIRRNQRDRDYCLAVLDLWAQVQEQGIEIGQVESFGFDTRILSPSEERLFRRDFGAYVETLPSGQKRPCFYNYVRRCDGSATPLDPMLKAVYED